MKNNPVIALYSPKEKRRTYSGYVLVFTLFAFRAQAQATSQDIAMVAMSGPRTDIAERVAARPRSPLGTESARCVADQTWDPGMGMCMARGAGEARALTFNLNQFALYSTTSGPRGLSRATGPGMWMATYDRALSPRNELRVDLMGSAEQLTVGDRGTPQLLQTEHVDSMHAHDTVMAFEFRDILALGADGKRHLTFLFAPRGEASVGPVPFMHRPSAEGNPDAPLGHVLQDGFHDASTVLGLAYRGGRTSVEATAFSGQGVTWPFPLHRLDSYAVRLNHDLNDQIGVGASYVDTQSPSDTGGAQHTRIVSGWLTTSHRIREDTLKTSFVWGRSLPGGSAAANSFLEEAVYQHDRNKVFGRAEALQLAPDQLDLATAGRPGDPGWVEALTLGYERTLWKQDHVTVFGGGSYTHDFVPSGFRAAYGSEPHGEKIYLRLKINGSAG
jgi:hypothetical protein